jgi:hypothetical protein
MIINLFSEVSTLCVPSLGGYLRKRAGGDIIYVPTVLKTHFKSILQRFDLVNNSSG